MDLFLMHGEADELSLHDMINQDMKEEFNRSYAEEFKSDFSLSNLDSGLFEPLFDLNGMMAMDDAMSTTSSVSSTPAASSTSSVSSITSMDDTDSTEGPYALDAHWIGSNMNKDNTFDLESTIFVDPSVVLPTSIPCNAPRNGVALSPMLSSSPISNSTSNVIGSQNHSVLVKSELTNGSIISNSATSNSQTPTQFTVVRPISNNSTLVAANQRQVSNSGTISAISIGSNVSNSTGHRVQISSNTIMNNRVGQSIVTQSNGANRIGLGNVVTSSLGNSNGAASNGHLFRGKPTSVSRNNGVNGLGSRRSSAEERTMPKPAYSYSCLIALALKNSSNGSLPVSEIYSFMCEYFPYFRSAPNGWKNSVRHNLSLNKCFEKIEKPVVSGNNQRKGCLWALNPNKVHKMDEEIQKWSKKDLQGIKDAMNTPEVLPALERGEMKFESSHSASSCSEDEDEDEVEADPLTLSNSDNTSTKLKINTNVRNTTLQGRTGATHLQINKSNGTIRNMSSGSGIISGLVPGAIISSSKLRGNLTSGGNSNITPPQDTTDYILPDSTMTEISLPTNGATVLDDLGNEISIEEEELVSSSVATPTRNLVVRKLPLTPARSPTSHRTNYVYTPPTLNSPHTINRLVLTNAKMT